MSEQREHRLNHSSKNTRVTRVKVIPKKTVGVTLPENLVKRAREQGLNVEHLLALLAKHSDAGTPPSLIKALRRWEANGTEARVQTQVILKVSKPEVLEEMRKSRAAKFLDEVLSPTTVVIKSGATQKVMEALTELGLLSEIVNEEK